MSIFANKVGDTVRAAADMAADKALDLASLLVSKPGQALALTLLAGCSDRTPLGSPAASTADSQPAALTTSATGTQAPSTQTTPQVNQAKEALDIAKGEVDRIAGEITSANKVAAGPGKDLNIAQLNSELRAAKGTLNDARLVELESRAGTLTPLQLVAEMRAIHADMEALAQADIAQCKTPEEHDAATRRFHELGKDNAIARLASLGRAPLVPPATVADLDAYHEAKSADLGAKLAAEVALENMNKAAEAAAKAAADAQAKAAAAAAAAAKPAAKVDPIAQANAKRLAALNALDEDTKLKYMWALRSIDKNTGAWVPGTFTFDQLSRASGREVWQKGKDHHNSFLPRPNGENNRGQQYIEGYDKLIRPIFQDSK